MAERVSEPSRSPETRRTHATVLLTTLGLTLAVGLVASGGLRIRHAAAAESPSSSPSDGQVAWPVPPDIRATAYVLIDPDNGQVLFSHNADMRVPVASTVKLLTALTVLRHALPSDLVTAGSEVLGLEGALTGIRPGDTWSVRQLLEALIARSGNDAAVVLATHVGGSVAGFVELMRTEASLLGLGGAVLESPSGLLDQNQLTATELAVIAQAAFAEPTIRDVASLAEVALPGLGRVDSRNLLLRDYSDATGLKTGFTTASGYSIVATAERGDKRVLAVLLGAPSSELRFEQARALLELGLDAFVRQPWLTDIAVRQGSAWHELTASSAPPVLPLGADSYDIRAFLPVHQVSPAILVAEWEGRPLLCVVVESADASQAMPHPSPPQAIGAWIMDQAYAAMRTATTADLWPSEAADQPRGCDVASFPFSTAGIEEFGS